MMVEEEEAPQGAESAYHHDRRNQRAEPPANGVEGSIDNGDPGPFLFWHSYLFLAFFSPTK